MLVDGCNVVLMCHTPHPDSIIAKAAATCYTKLPIDDISLNRREEERLIHKLIKNNHLSPFEHASFTFSITNISRSCLCQLTRHRIASYSVRSQRFVASNLYVNPFPKGSKLHDEFNIWVGNIVEYYNNLVDNNVKKEDARSILPNAMTTQLVMTINARSLINYFNLRLCGDAQKEIRGLSLKMLNLVREVAPITFGGNFPNCSLCNKKRICKFIK